jgi:hypothetical protein
MKHPQVKFKCNKLVRRQKFRNFIFNTYTSSSQEKEIYGRLVQEAYLASIQSEHRNSKLLGMHLLSQYLRPRLKDSERFCGAFQ